MLSLRKRGREREAIERRNRNAAPFFLFSAVFIRVGLERRYCTTSSAEAQQVGGNSELRGGVLIFILSLLAFSWSLWIPPYVLLFSIVMHALLPQLSCFLRV
jgi:hypothetical protein